MGYNIFSKISLIFFILTVFSSYLIWHNMYSEDPVVVDYIKLHSKTENIGNSFETTEANILDINTVNFNPIEGEGAMGKGVIIPPEQMWLMYELFGINYYNLLASDRIPLNRTLPDMRSDSCQLKKYPKILPETSVIIIFHNEAWSVLLRTVWSVINHTPQHLLKEIILVDDASERVFLKDELDQYIKQIPVSIKIIRMPKRKGIVGARLAGANAARGETLTFLDAHCECTEGWIEPLLARIKEHRNTVICPHIDLIEKTNLGYTKIVFYYYTINWDLQLGTNHIFVKHVSNIPIKTPIMSGGLFSIDRNYFYQMGTYDAEMKIWGGENIEMSFRIWQCGGQVEIHPCSNVGHINRDANPFTFPGGKDNTIQLNLERTALVWMDEWSDFFFIYNSLNIENIHNRRNRINVTDRLKLRKRLRCKPFSWYLTNIWPDNHFPAHNRFYGKIVWLNGSPNLVDKYDKLLCKILSKVVPTKWSDIIEKIWQNAHMLINSINYTEDNCLQPHWNVSKCDKCYFAGIGNCLTRKRSGNNFVITDDGIIMTNEDNCINFNPIWRTENSYNVALYRCDYKTSWEYDFYSQKIFISNTDLCLTVETDLVTMKNVQNFINYTAINLITVKKCSFSLDAYQKWALIPLPWKL